MRVWLPVIALNFFQCSLLFTVKLYFDALAILEFFMPIKAASIDLEKQAMLQQELL